MADYLTFKCSDGHDMAYNLWLPQKDTPIRGILQIYHGMAEYSDRYEDFAHFLNSHGYIVFADDHRGHGHSSEPENLGWFAEKDGWALIARDEYEFALYMKDRLAVKDVPFVLLGHSMGSFLARTVITDHPDLYDSVIIMGTGCSKGAIGKIGKVLAKALIRVQGSKAEGKTLNSISFGAYLKKIDSPKTEYDWLSRDEREVRKYIDDPLCGFICKNGFFYDLLTGVECANDPKRAHRLRKDMRMLIISGSMDPVGDWGAGVRKVYDLYRNAGLEDVTLTLIDGARHEILNETDKTDTYHKILSFLDGLSV